MLETYLNGGLRRQLGETAIQKPSASQAIPRENRGLFNFTIASNDAKRSML
jgi:hypothetical protein